MIRIVAALVAAGLLAQTSLPAACATARAAEPFEPVPEQPAVHESHRLAGVSLVAGAGLIGLSFALTAHANRTYDDYLVATDPGEVSRLYDETTRYDRWSAASLLTGEALIAAAVWLRFLHRPAARVSLRAEPARCAVTLRF